MEDVSNIPFRLLCQKYGAGITYTQQISAIALLRENEKALKLIRRAKEEKIVGLQLFGRNPENLLKAAKKYGGEFEIIDLNFGCPSRKVVEQGYGSALLREKGRIKKIVNTLSKGLDKVVTVKMRSGFKKVEAVELVKVIEKAGAAAITIHARTQKQGYSGKADWEIIRKVKESVKIPIIGNGDVVDEESAEKMLKETGCDYVMIARGAMKNPFLFKRINHYLETGEKLKQKSKVELFEEYYKLCEEYRLISISNLRQMACYFTQGMDNSAELRDKIQKSKSVEEILNYLNQKGKSRY